MPLQLKPQHQKSSNQVITSPVVKKSQVVIESEMYDPDPINQSGAESGDGCDVEDSMESARDQVIVKRQSITANEQHSLAKDASDISRQRSAISGKHRINETSGGQAFKM